MNKEIIIVTVSLGNDGAERVLTLLANEFVNNYDVTVIQTKPGTYGNSYTSDERIKFLNFEYNGENSIKRYFVEIKLLRSYLKERKNAVIISFLSQSIFETVIARIGLKNKVIVSERNDPRRCPIHRSQRIIRDAVFRLADVCVFQTEMVQKLFPKSVQRKSVVIPNPVNPNLQEPYIGVRSHRIVTACRLHPQKNLFMLLDAFSMFCKKHPDYILDIYGKGTLEKELKDKANKLGLSNKVVFHGFVEDIHEKIEMASMYVCSSDYEGISNSILEAMALGIPTISTDCPIGGSKLLIDQNRNGILVPVNDANKLCEAMMKIACDKDFADRISANAVQVRNKYSIERIAKSWENLFND